MLVDPSKQSVELATERVLKTGFGGSIESFSSPELVSGQYRLAVISTSSRDRFTALSGFLQNAEADHFLLEKLLATDLEILNKIADLASKVSSQFWVNCPMPFFPHYEKVKNELEKSLDLHPLMYSVHAGNYGLVTNFIHYLDHFYALSGEEILNLTIRPGARLVESKRRGYSELVGSISALTKSGNQLFVEFSDDYPDEVQKVEIRKGKLRWIIDELALTKATFLGDGTSVIELINTPKQSELTHLSLERLDLGQKPEWATLVESTVLHQKLLEELGRFLGKRSEIAFT